MTESTVPARSEIAEKDTWNNTSVFDSIEAWEAACSDLAQTIPQIESFKGRLSEGPGTLAEALQVIDAFVVQLGKTQVYAGMSHSADTSDQEAAGRYGQSQSLGGRASAALAFLDPELISIGVDTLKQWREDEPRLTIYEHYIENLFRKQAHVRSGEVEEILGLLGDPFSGTSGTARMLTNADFQFEAALTSEGVEVEVTQGTEGKIRSMPNRELRRTAWENYADRYLAYKNTLASNLATSIKQNVFQARVRRHDSTLESALHPHNISVDVFHNLINTFQKNLPTWHRYWAIRRKALGVDELHAYDIWAPLTESPAVVSFEQAVDWICEGLAPMGEDYVASMRKGSLEDRWIDVYPNIGKRAGAFSYGEPGTFPFIMMSYTDTVFSLSTLAHELGHSMHSYLAWQNQPTVYGDYSLFVAEVASNFHQAMVRAYLLKSNPDPVFQINVIEEAMANFHRYFLVMPTLARFEFEVHEMVERGEGLTADAMTSRLADLFSEAYGETMQIDRDRVGIQWAMFGHLYTDYYVFQYATGISGAHALANRILAGEEGAVEDYLNFLKAGGSGYPLRVLRSAGVDLAQPDPVEETFGVLADMVDRLETLLG